MPSPVSEDTGRIGASARPVPATRSRISSVASVERLVVDEVAFRERDHAPAHAEDVEDLQVLLGLRLPPLVGRDHEQHEPDRTDAGEHVRR